MKIKELFYLPNMLSLLRIMFIPFIFYLLIENKPENYITLLALYIAGFLLDFFDGYFARRLNLTSELGKVLDPLSDKIFIISVVIALVIKGRIQIWLATIIILRDFIIMLGSYFIYKKINMIKPSKIIGKITLTGVALYLMVCVINLQTKGDGFFIIKQFLQNACVSFLLWSMVDYYIVFKEVWKREK